MPAYVEFVHEGKFMVRMVLAAVFAFCSVPAAAQSTTANALGATMIMERLSAADVAALLADFNITTASESFELDGTSTLRATTSGGASFFATLMNCATPASGADCTHVLLYTGISNAGLAYEDINSFNTEAEVTKAVNVGPQRVVIFGTQIFARGGIGPNNFKLYVALFLRDMQNFMNSRAETVQVSNDQPRGQTSKVDNHQVIGADDVVSAPFSASALAHGIDSAIANTWTVEFASDATDAFTP